MKSNSLRLIYKINTKQLKKANWNLTMPFETAIRDYPDIIVSISDSQLLRFIDKLNGVNEGQVEKEVAHLKNRLRSAKRRPKSADSRMEIRELYKSLYQVQFQPDYICVVMNSERDYDRANEGFTVNGIRFKRFLGTNGGIKNSTIVYVNEKLYPELKRRMDNGRNKDVPLVPAKLEAYQALICSGSTPVEPPSGIIVVKDCITHFKEDVIMIDDEQLGEPVMTSIKDFEIENDDSDGYGLMLPSYAQKVNRQINQIDSPLSGMNTRYAWNKGMLFTFDFIEFAEKIAKTYYIKDVWGDVRDIRDAEVILTESMLKLWECYDSWEDYYENCQKNGYEFSVTKVCPEELENIRNTNYQFLQSYSFTDEEIQELCQPSIDEIKGVLGMDYRKSLLFLAGFGLTESTIKNNNIDIPTKALLLEPSLINDPFIRRKIWNMIVKRIEMCKRGAIRINANFGIISGDPYALCQSMFGMEITGLLKAGEVYHKYWLDKQAEEIACFRAPMTCHNNIVKLKVCDREEPQYWFRYIKTAVVLNAWDSTRNSLNGADCDGDLFFTTNDPIILKNTLHTPTIVCVQRKADKIIVQESDIVKANKIGFTDEIGIVTNHATSMFEVQAGFSPDSEEYKALSYRIMCSQLFQQNVIDSIKGIIAKSMPEYWYSIRDNLVKDGDSDEVIQQKLFNQKIAAYRKPYFMTYVYPSLRTRNNNHNKNSNNGVLLRFGSYGINSVTDLINYEPKTQEMYDCLKNYDDLIGSNPCTVNRICWLLESVFDGYLSKRYEQPEFDYSVLKCDAEYSQQSFNEIKKIYKRYRIKMDEFNKKANSEKNDSYDLTQRKTIILNEFRRQCELVCPNEKELCNILADICYTSETTKHFFWDIAGETVVKNLLEKHNYHVSFPQLTDGEGEFEYCGSRFEMKDVCLSEMEYKDYDI